MLPALKTQVTDRTGSLINYTGSESFNEFLKKFNNFLQDNGLSNVMNEDYEILGPQKPEAALNKRRAAQRTTENEDKQIKEWREFKLKLTEKAGIILGYLLKTLSKDINIWIENTYPDINADPTIANY